jgi:hypothetical protein
MEWARLGDAEDEAEGVVMAWSANHVRFVFSPLSSVFFLSFFSLIAVRRVAPTVALPPLRNSLSSPPHSQPQTFSFLRFVSLSLFPPLPQNTAEREFERAGHAFHPQGKFLAVLERHNSRDVVGIYSTAGEWSLLRVRFPPSLSPFLPPTCIPSYSTDSSIRRM